MKVLNFIPLWYREKERLILIRFLRTILLIELIFFIIFAVKIRSSIKENCNLKVSKLEILQKNNETDNKQVKNLEENNTIYQLDIIKILENYTNLVEIKVIKIADENVELKYSCKDKDKFLRFIKLLEGSKDFKIYNIYPPQIENIDNIVHIEGQIYLKYLKARD